MSHANIYYIVGSLQYVFYPIRGDQIPGACLIIQQYQTRIGSHVSTYTSNKFKETAPTSSSLLLSCVFVAIFGSGHPFLSMQTKNYHIFAVDLPPFRKWTNLWSYLTLLQYSLRSKLIDAGLVVQAASINLDLEQYFLIYMLSLHSLVWLGHLQRNSSKRISRMSIDTFGTCPRTAWGREHPTLFSKFTICPVGRIERRGGHVVAFGWTCLCGVCMGGEKKGGDMVTFGWTCGCPNARKTSSSFRLVYNQEMRTGPQIFRRPYWMARAVRTLRYGCFKGPHWRRHYLHHFCPPRMCDPIEPELM